MIDNLTLTETTATLVAAYVVGNAVSASDLPTLLRSVHDTLSCLGKPVVAALAVSREPAVPIKRSVTDDYIVCLDDGRKLKALKRHLAGLGMTPADYRAKWGLPKDYPMVAPAYAKARSELAKARGLGRKRETAE